jgi:hypothetical protein
MHLSMGLGTLALLAGLGLADQGQAQLLDRSRADEAGLMQGQGVAIGKSLLEQIGSGHGDIYTWGSSQYLIARDPARSIRRGRQLFQRKFSADEGLGPRVNYHSSGDITDSRALGAGLTDSCATCHGRPRGAAGFGGDVVTRPDSRDAPHLFGLGLVEMLADEMTTELRGIRTQALAEAESSQQSVRRHLRAKKVKFGYLTANPDGSVETGEIEGVDIDLRVNPFFHHGGTASMREFIIGAFRDEMGLQAYDPILCAATDAANPQAATSPAGFNYDPALDDFERPPVCDVGEDADLDGYSNEIDTALVDHMEFYLLNYFKPGSYRQSETTRRGQQQLKRIGCNQCHKKNLTVDNDRRVADVETAYDPGRGIFNSLYAEASTQFTVFDDGDSYPLLIPNGEHFTVKNLYSDLKRHDLGAAFHERDYDGSVVTEFVTEPLWGVGSTAPYGHDGRSINLDAVIRRHGGEADKSRREYEKLRPRERQALLAFLSSLVLFPPDDTASNLNPGNPGTTNPQDPAEHGSINLGALFQIQEEGEE